LHINKLNYRRSPFAESQDKFIQNNKEEVLKIVFLCGSLEPGIDGVGDYTRILSAQLIKQGHSIVMIALNDKAALAMIEEQQMTDSVKIPALRIPFNYSPSERFTAAKKYVDSFNPDWLSLQYVPYSFHKKGLPFGLREHLQQLGEGRKWHIMFHELWIGFTKISPLKHKMIGMVQKKIVTAIVRSLQPNTVTTTNRLYQLLLQKTNIKAEILPLFSNIPVASIERSFTLSVLTKLDIKEAELGQYIITGFFGNLYPQAELEQALTKQLYKAVSSKKKMVCLGFGNINRDGLHEFKRLEAAFAGRIKFLYLGKQPAKNISNLLQMLDIAFSCTPSQHIGKSGVFAAMKLHGVDVIVPNGDVIPEYDDEIKKYNKELTKRPADHWNVSYTASHFLNYLTAADVKNL
jgi:hypothetical protein